MTRQKANPHAMTGEIVFASMGATKDTCAALGADKTTDYSPSGSPTVISMSTALARVCRSAMVWGWQLLLMKNLLLSVSEVLASRMPLLEGHGGGNDWY